MASPGRRISRGIEYLLRTNPPRIPESPEELSAPASNRRLWHIAGIGRDDKFGVAFERLGPQAPGAFQLPTADLLSGLHGFGTPIAFVVTGAAGRISIDAGIWTSHAQPSAGLLDDRAHVLATVLRSLYPVVNLNPTHGATPDLPHCELALGVPTVKAPTSYDGVVQYDRIIRSMADEEFQIVVLAQPLADRAVDQLRNTVITEMRTVREAERAESLPSPLSEHYLDSLKKYLSTLTTASAVGAWRTAVYLRGTERSLPRLTSVWRSTFSGSDSIPDAVRTHHTPMAHGWAVRWSLPQVDGSPSEGGLIRLFELQTVLPSDRLAAYVHLPEREAPGFAVDAVARFDSVGPTPTPDAATIRLGAVVHAGRVTSDSFTIPLDTLTKHALVCGVTGSGKSTTIRHLLAELARRDVPFLVIEPAKAEYRALASLPELRGRLRVLTVSDERGSALRLNPLVPSEGSSVAVHLDMLKALFSASFGLWAPLPQILERCLHELYAESGWDLARNTSTRMSPSTRWESAFPTLSQLSAKVDAYIDSLGYRGEVTANMRAALSTRISGLTIGGKGRMFDTGHSISAHDLFEEPVVLELENLADEEDQAFLMGLLLIRLVQHRRAVGHHHGLRHLMVVEEAHRLLARTQPAAGDAASPRTRAVESFANLLAETRAYGQGVLVADQVPVKLAPDVIKNSNLKVVHRLVAEDDRQALASATVMEERQRRSLATLQAGEAAVFSEGQDAPLLVRLDAGVEVQTPTDATFFAAVDPPATTCRDACRGLPCCADAQAAITPSLLQAFFRMAQGALYEPGACSRIWPEIVTSAAALIAGLEVDQAAYDCIRYRASERWAVTRGGQYRWSFDTVDRIRGLLADAAVGASADAAERFATAVQIASTRHHDPFPRCTVICPNAACLHRHAAADGLTAETSATMHPLVSTTAAAEVNPVRELWIQAAEVASRAVVFPTQDLPLDSWERVQSGAVGFVRCTAQQVVMSAPAVALQARVAFLDEVLTAAPTPASNAGAAT